MSCKLKQIRKAKNFSQYELAKRAGVAQSYIHDIETGAKSPTVRILEKLAVALDVSIVDLLEERHNPKAV